MSDIQRREDQPKEVDLLEELRTPREPVRVARHNDGSIVLLDPLAAYEQEAARMRAAGPRRRITADDLDNLL